MVATSEVLVLPCEETSWGRYLSKIADSFLGDSFRTSFLNRKQRAAVSFSAAYVKIPLNFYVAQLRFTVAKNAKYTTIQNINHIADAHLLQSPKITKW